MYTYPFPSHTDINQESVEIYHLCQTGVKSSQSVNQSFFLDKSYYYRKKKYYYSKNKQKKTNNPKNDLVLFKLREFSCILIPLVTLQSHLKSLFLLTTNHYISAGRSSGLGRDLQFKLHVSCIPIQQKEDNRYTYS